MIIYQATKAQFAEDVLYDRIENRILDFFKKNLHRSTSPAEITAWKNSMIYIDRALADVAIPEDCGVAIEYQIPQTSKRLDFLLTGIGADQKEYVIIIELKQWSEATLSEKDGIINSFVGKNIRELNHPSYQAWSYATLLQNFNETIATEQINLQPCAYLHNYKPDSVIRHPHYQGYIDRAPVFLKGETVMLRDFIKKYVKYGDRSQILFRIEHSRIRPSKMLADSVGSMLKGNAEFTMVDDQKIVYETAMAISRTASPGKKKVLIVKGGPGTGKSVVAVNLLAGLLKLGKNAMYVSKNAAPRAVYASRLTGTYKKTVINNLFTGSGSFITTEPNSIDTLIVDEAHRLNERSGLYGNLGENQVKELIRASCATIFFIDEDQRVTLSDIGTVGEIRKWADRHGAEIYETDLSSQFRCNGSDGYLAWLDHMLQIRDTANTTLDTSQYDFRVFDSPTALREAIEEKNRINNRSRMVAGYCWEWKSKKNPQAYDVAIPEFDFKMRWNLTTDGSLWIISPDSINEIGCIHTCQGLEVDYIGVIVGADLIVRNGKMLTQPAARARGDKSIFGYKRVLETKGEAGKDVLRGIIKNTYRTLFTRGMKGCYVYFVDEEAGEWVKELTS